MPLKAGTKQPLSGGADGYINSMAQEMERAFREEWPYLMNGDVPQQNEQLRLLFIAIAKGVVRHLRDNPESFKVNVSTGETGEVYRVDTI